MSYYAHLAAALAAADAAPDVPNAEIPYTDDFSSVSISPANGWEPAGQVVDGAPSIGGGDLIYTAGAGDGSQPRIARAINVTPSSWYRVQAPAPTGTAADNEVWVSGNGGSFADALTPVVADAALDEVFQAPDPGFGIIWAVLRMGLGWTAGETARLGEISVTATTAPAGLGTPVFLEDLLVSGTTSATIESGVWSPAANADVFVPFFGRGSSRTHDSVTAGFTTVAGFTKVADVEVESFPGVFFRLSLWRATTTATPGTGTVTATASGSLFSSGIGGVAITNVGSLVTFFDEGQASGTSISGTLTGATTDDVAIVCTVAAGDRPSFTFSDGLTEPANSPVNQSSNFTMGLGWKETPSVMQETTGLSASQGSVTVGVLLRGS